MILNNEPSAKDESIVTIYQNEDHIAGLLQQLYRAGVMVGQSEETSSQAQNTSTAEGKAETGFRAELAVPGLGKVAGNVGGSGGGGTNDTRSQGVTSRREYVYSQAYYLHLIRRYLRDAKLIKKIDDGKAETVMHGDFVEFSATFRSNEVTDLLDIFSPELIAEMVRFKYRREAIDNWDGYLDFNERKSYVDKCYTKADAYAEMAAAATRAVRQDFRSDGTREFYAELAPGKTVVVICENESFLTADKDRILDGRFTVLGKVSDQATDSPLLARNKLLWRVNPEFLDGVFSVLAESAEMPKKVTKLVEDAKGEASAGPETTKGATKGADKGADKGAEVKSVPTSFDGAPIDTSFNTRISGESTKVIPLAIYV